MVRIYGEKLVLLKGLVEAFCYGRFIIYVIVLKLVSHLLGGYDSVKKSVRDSKLVQKYVEVSCEEFCSKLSFVVSFEMLDGYVLLGIFV